MKLPFRSAAVLLCLTSCHVSKEDAGRGGIAASVNGIALDGSLTRGWTAADEEIRVPIWLGDEDHGALVMPMWRGAAAGIEDYIFTPKDGDCANARALFRLDWNVATNTVRYQLKFKKVPVKPE